MRDDFSAAVKATLAQRVANRCSNPACGAVTSGPALQPSDSVNVGVAAHITAASPGGARYDASLTQRERSAAPNGIWLCYTCSKLIDSDVHRYTVPLLQAWKAQAEDRTAKMLASGLGHADDSVKLIIPAVESADALLSFANVRTRPVGREDELAELRDFLSMDAPFSWWLWTGPAGVGKSRLAVELCRAVSQTWHAGFLRELDESSLEEFQPLQPTLIVIDYAAQRSEWLSDALLRFSQRTGGAPVRVLILERDNTGPWWATAQRLNRFEESVQIAGKSYGKPRPLAGMSREEIRRLIRDAAPQVGAALSSTDIEDIADHAEQIDPLGRPLFALIALLDWLDGKGISAGRDDALRRLLARMDGQTAERLGDSRAAQVVRNLRTLATALGGTSVDDYSLLLGNNNPPDGLLPGEFDDFHGLSVDELLDGVRPDILGELYVLDRLAAGGVERAAATRLLRLAWQTSPNAYHAFVERAAGDYSEHPNLVDLLDVGDWLDSPVQSAKLAVDTVPLLRRSDHPALEWIFARLHALQEASGDAVTDELVATARFRFANLVMSEGDARSANELFASLAADCDPRWPVLAGVFNNRGITWLDLDREEPAVADFTAVIDSASASDEMRACAFNNRADVYEADGKIALAIADRTAVLNLGETTYDRRYIALSRRARALWKTGDHASAYRDIDAIVATPDIAEEQKMEARLLRAEWFVDTASPEQAEPELIAVSASARNFAGVEARARSLLETLNRHGPNTESPSGGQ